MKKAKVKDENGNCVELKLIYGNSPPKFENIPDEAYENLANYFLKKYLESLENCEKSNKEV